uniref:Uncharacterized protein n=1 Tax=Rhodopseudomonas palustris (strain BisA53) TaxID=316055 RepID=Q07H40_RHOP5
MIYQGLANLFLICSQRYTVNWAGKPLMPMPASLAVATIAVLRPSRMQSIERKSFRSPWLLHQRTRKVSPINSDVRSAQACARDTRLRRISGVDGNVLHKTSATRRPNDDLVTGSGRATMRV